MILIYNICRDQGKDGGLEKLPRLLGESGAQPASRAEPRSGQQPWKLGTPAAWRGRAAPENKREKQKEVKIKIK